MAVPIPADPPTSATVVNPRRNLYVRERQNFAVEQEKDRQRQALFLLGEYVMFILMWHNLDFEDGLVTKCSRCFGSGNDVDDRISAVYEQPTQNKCPVCYGTTFEGGIKATIIRPAILHDADKDERLQPKGVTHSSDLTIESTQDFRVRNGDYCFRQSGERYYLRAPERMLLRTGFSTPHQSTDSITYNNLRATLEDKTSVAYLIPPTTETLSTILAQSARRPIDFTEWETINAPLIPVSDDG